MNSDQAQVLSGMKDEDFFSCVIPEVGDRNQVWAELPTARRALLWMGVCRPQLLTALGLFHLPLSCSFYQLLLNSVENRPVWKLYLGVTAAHADAVSSVEATIYCTEYAALTKKQRCI